MIKAIVIDVDGVVIGEKKGYNFPNPHQDIIARFKKIEKKNIPISLCTAKPYFSIENIVKDASLHNLHITNGGGVIINPIDNLILRSHFIDKEVAKKIVQDCLDRNTYVEIYSINEYFAQKNQESDITPLHTEILQYKPHLVDSLIKEIENKNVVKIMPVVKDDEDMMQLDAILTPYKESATISWGSHPVALPRRFGVITAKGISKQQAVMEIANHEHISPAELLGIGDSTADWQFIQKCGYGGAMGNASEELKKLVKTKGEGKYAIGKSVDENGILDILDYFKL